MNFEYCHKKINVRIVLTLANNLAFTNLKN